jgi:integrase
MSELVAIGLRPGELVRFRRNPADRWRLGTARRVESDGSLGLTDTKGAARAIPLDQVEVRVKGPRGAARWEPLPDRVARDEQLPLL